MTTLSQKDRNMSIYKFDADGDRLDWVLAEADDLTGKSLVNFTGRYGGGVDLVMTNSIYSTKYMFRLKFTPKQIRDFLAAGVRELGDKALGERVVESAASNVIPLRKR